MTEEVTYQSIGSLDALFEEPTARVIEWFIVHEKWEQNQKDLCENCRIYPKAMRKVLKKLERLGIISITRRIAKSKFYKVNQDSPIIAPLRRLSQQLAMQLATAEAEKQLATEK